MGVVWIQNDKHVGVMYDDSTWEAFTHVMFGEKAMKELNFSEETAVVGVLEGVAAGTTRPTACLLGLTRRHAKSTSASAFACVANHLCPSCHSANGDWELFDKYRTPPDDKPFAKTYAKSPLPFSLSAGDHARTHARTHGTRAAQCW